MLVNCSEDQARQEQTDTIRMIQSFSSFLADDKQASSAVIFSDTVLIKVVESILSGGAWNNERCSVPH